MVSKLSSGMGKRSNCEKDASDESDVVDNTLLPDVGSMNLTTPMSATAKAFYVSCRESLAEGNVILDQDAYTLVILTLRLCQSENELLTFEEDVISTDPSWSEKYKAQRYFGSFSAVRRFIVGNDFRIVKDSPDIAAVVAYASKALKKPVKKTQKRKDAEVVLSQDDSSAAKVPKRSPKSSSPLTTKPVVKPSMLPVRKQPGERVMRRFVPMFLWYDVLETLHESQMHMGQTRLWHAVNQACVGIPREAVRKFVSVCQVCQVARSTAHLRNPPIITQIKETEFHGRAQIDLIDMSKYAENDGRAGKEMRYILHYKDHMTKFTWLMPLPTKEAVEVARCLEIIWGVLGPPTILQSDNGKEFVARVIKDVCQKWSSTMIIRNGAPYHPQSQGLVEKGNHTVEQRLSAMFAQNRRSWPTLLPQVMLAMNTSRSEATDATPYELVFGRKPIHMHAGLDLSLAEREAAMEGQLEVADVHSPPHVDNIEDDVVQYMPIGPLTPTCSDVPETSNASASRIYSPVVQQRIFRQQPYYSNKSLSCGFDSLLVIARHLDGAWDNYVFGVGDDNFLDMLVTHVRTLQESTRTLTQAEVNTMRDTMYFEGGAASRNLQGRIVMAEISELGDKFFNRRAGGSSFCVQVQRQQRCPLCNGAFFQNEVDVQPGFFPIVFNGTTPEEVGRSFFSSMLRLSQSENLCKTCPERPACVLEKFVLPLTADEYPRLVVAPLTGNYPYIEGREDRFDVDTRPEVVNQRLPERMRSLMDVIHYEGAGCTYVLKGLIFGNGRHFIATFRHASTGDVHVFDDQKPNSGAMAKLPVNSVAESITYIVGNSEFGMDMAPTAAIWMRQDASVAASIAQVARCPRFELPYIMSLNTKPRIVVDITNDDAVPPAHSESDHPVEPACTHKEVVTEVSTAHRQLRSQAIAALEKQWDRREKRNANEVVTFAPGTVVLILLTACLPRKRRLKFGNYNCPAVVIRQLTKSGNQHIDSYELLTLHGVLVEHLKSDVLAEMRGDEGVLVEMKRCWEKYSNGNNRTSQVNTAVSLETLGNFTAGGPVSQSPTVAKISCACKQGCQDRRCACIKGQQKCGPTCHKGRTCTNCESPLTLDSSQHGTRR